MSHQRGEIVITDGSGHVTTLLPDQNNMILVSDSTANYKIRYQRWQSLDKSRISRSILGYQGTFTASFTKAIRFTLFGSNYATITSIIVLSAMASGGTSYDIQVIDTSNSNVICTFNSASTTIVANNMGTLSNLPAAETTVEMQCRYNGGLLNKIIYIDEITIKYDII